MTTPDSIKRIPVTIPKSHILELMQAVHEKGASFRFQARGNSMRPAIQDKDWITISPLRDTVPFVGEVVAYRHPVSQSLIVHRIDRTTQHSFLIKGDNQFEPDAIVSIDDIIGVVTGIQRNKKSISIPDRSKHPGWTRLYFLWSLLRVHLRRTSRRLKRKIKTYLNRS